MNSQDIQNLQESYLAVYDDETRENLEFENWVNNLLDEGYDLSSYTWDEMAEIYIDEAREPGVPEYKPNRLNPLPAAKPLSGKKGDGSGYGDPKKFTQDTDAKSFKPGVDVPKVKKFGRISRIIPHGIGDHATPTQSRVSVIVRKDPGAPTSQKLPPPDKKKPSKKIVRRGNQNEAYDLYDVILSHLIDEGYADTFESAEAIMVNMSEDWRESIVEQASTVASSGGAGGKVTADKQYPATLRGLKGVKSTDSKGTEYFQPYTSSGRKEPSGKPFEPTTMPDANRAQYKQLYSGKYENIPASQSTKNPESHLFRTGVPRVNRGTATYGID